MSMTDTTLVELPLADRSTLEGYGDCPMSVRLCETAVKSVGEAAIIGSEAHGAIGRTIGIYCESGESGVPMGPQDVQAVLVKELSSCRADVAAKVNAIMQPWVCWRVANIIAGVNPSNILKHDGGVLDRSGQMARDLSFARVTSEVDLLYQTRWEGVLCEVDWKSGRKLYSASTVESAFQFRLHATLVFEAFPKIHTLQVKVMNLRNGELTRHIEFRRSDDDTLWAEVSMRAQDWYQNRNLDPKDAEARPSREKCRICDAAAMCHVVDRDIGIVAENPEAAVQWYIAAKATVDQAKGLLLDFVEKTGKDIRTEDGDAFGYLNRPATVRRPVNPLYDVLDIDGGGEDDDDSED